MKKALALLLVLVLAIGMGTSAFAATAYWRVKPALKDGNIDWAVGFTGSTSNDFDAQDEPSISFPLMAAGFNGEATGKATSGVTDFASPGGPLTKEEISASKIVVKVKHGKNSTQVLDEVKIDGSDVKIVWKSPFANNNPDGLDYNFTVYLAVDGKSWQSVGIEFDGNYKNKVDDTADADTDWFDFSDGGILKPTAFIRMLEGELGEGVIVNMRALKNAKYWAVANSDITDEDQELLIKHSAIDQVFHIEQKGVAAVANFIILEDADPTAYVYTYGDAAAAYVYGAASDVAGGKNLVLIGRGGDKLPFADTYFLASAELDIDEEVEPEEEEEEEIDDEYDIGDNSGTGGDDLYPENPHDNPGTGK